MDIINLSTENIDKEHICCALDSKTSNIGVASKKEWLTQRFKDGLKFKKLNARGKVFIEYIPSNNSWMPVEAYNYMQINCLWVSGSYKGKGYGKVLLSECEEDAKEMNGVVVVVAKKKKPFIADKSFFIKHGYTVCDSANPYFELLVKRFNQDAEFPRFATSAKEGMPKDIRGIDIFYTAQCPFTIPYIDLLKPVILASEIPVRTYQIKSTEEAKTHFSPITTYSVFINGEFYTNEILTPKKLEQLIEKQL